jgi:hypothetical protein
MKITISIIIFLMSLTISATELSLIGKGMLEYSIFNIDIYEVLYYKGSDGTEELVLDYQTNVKRKYSQKGWSVGLEPILEKNPAYKPKAQWILDQTVDLAKGDKMTLRRKKSQVTMLKNGQSIATIDDPIIAKILYEPWLGEVSVDEDLKQKILGKKQ